jgi:hypothetical protein
MMFWNQFTNWIKNNKFYIIVIAVFFVLVIGARIFVIYNKGNIPNPIANQSNTISPQKLVTVSSPRPYQNIQIGDIIKLELSQVYLDPIEVVLVSLDSTQSDKPQFKEYSLGQQKFNRGFIEINSKAYEPGQYRINLLQNNQNIGQSPLFALIREKQNLTITNPVEKQIVNADNNSITWNFTPDIFFVNIYLESDNERFVLAQNRINTGEFDWNFADMNGRNIQNGEYVLIIEDSFTKTEFGKVRFKVNQ